MSTSSYERPNIRAMQGYTWGEQPEDGKTRAWLYRSGAVLAENTSDDGCLVLTLMADEYLMDRLKKTDGVKLRVGDPLPKIHSVQMETMNGVE